MNSSSLLNNLNVLENSSNYIYTELNSIFDKLNKINELKEKVSDEKFIKLNNDLAFICISIEFINNRLNSPGSGENFGNHNPKIQIQKLKKFNIELNEILNNNN